MFSWISQTPPSLPGTLAASVSLRFSDVSSSVLPSLLLRLRRPEMHRSCGAAAGEPRPAPAARGVTRGSPSGLTLGFLHNVQGDDVQDRRVKSTFASSFPIPDKEIPADLVPPSVIPVNGPAPGTTWPGQRSYLSHSKADTVCCWYPEHTEIPFPIVQVSLTALPSTPRKATARTPITPTLSPSWCHLRYAFIEPQQDLPHRQTA